MSDKKSILGAALDLLTNPLVTAAVGAGAGYYFFGREDGKTKKGKAPYIAAGSGAVAGYFAGKMIAGYLTPAPAVALPVQQQPQLPPAEYDAQQGYGDYSMPDVDSAFGQQPLGQQGVSREQVPIQDDINQSLGLGTLDGSNFGTDFGSLGGDGGMSDFDEELVEEVIAETKRGMN